MAVHGEGGDTMSDFATAVTEGITALTKDRPHSENNPYHMAIYLHGLIKAATLIVEEHGSSPATVTGISALMTIAEERADALSRVLDAPAFCELWPELNEWLNRDGSLGLAEGRQEVPQPAGARKALDDGNSP